MVAGFILIAIGITSTFSALATKIKKDQDDNYIYQVHNLMTLTSEKYTWIYLIALQVVVSLLNCTFQVFLSFKICVSLRESISFLRASNATESAVHAYQKIITFCRIVRGIFIVYNFALVMLEIGLLIYKNLVAFFSIELGRDDHELVTAKELIKYLMNLLQSVKPACYAMAYIWIKK